MTGKRKIDFTIMSTRKSHKTLDLSSLAPVMIDVEAKEATIEMGALHARSAVERGIKFGADLAEVPNGKTYYIIWVSSDKNEEGPYYYGAASCMMIIDREARRGYKILADHVNSMDRAMKGQFTLDDLGPDEKKILRDFLIERSAEMWENSPDALKEALDA